MVLWNFMTGLIPPMTFSTYEPLHSIPSSQYLTRIRNQLNCNISSPLISPFYRNSMLKSIFKLWPASITDVSYYNRACVMSSQNLIKTIRFQFDDAIKLLKDPVVGPSLKIIHMVRDPRGIIASRKRVAEFEKSEQTLCNEMELNLKIANQLKKSHLKSQVKQIRYEDLALDSINVMKDIWRFLGLDLTKFKIRYINYFTKNKTNLTGTMVVTKDSVNVYKRWLGKMKYSEIETIQKTCSSVMELAGYKKIKTANDLNPQFQPLIPLSRRNGDL